MTAPRFIARSEAARLAIGRTPGHTLLHKRAEKAPFVSCGSVRESSHGLEVNDGCHHTIGDLEDRPRSAAVRVKRHRNVRPPLLGIRSTVPRYSPARSSL